jgi:hypothetical protein
MNKADYQNYLASAHWQAIRERKLSSVDHRCEFRAIVTHAYDPSQRCAETKNLQVHHLHYQSIGNEWNSDLEVLCPFHHLVREAIGNLDCPECGDGPMQYDESDILEEIQRAIDEAGGPQNVDLQDIRDRCSWLIECSYCSR